MRLIDAEALLERIASINNPDMLTIGKVAGTIDTQPTAYDIDKVVEELFDDDFVRFDDDFVIPRDRAIEIVKQNKCLEIADEMLKGKKTMQNNEKLTTVQKIKDRNTSEQDAIKILEEHDKMVQAEMNSKISEMMKKIKENPLYGLVFGMTLSLSDEHFKELEEKVKAMQGENK